MKKNRVLTKAIAMVLVIMTVMSVFSMSFTASAMDMENASKQAASAIITTGVGKIPVVGDFAKSALEPILSELFGIKSENEEILEKLDEISTKLDELKDTLDKDTQTILKTLSSAQRNEFNSNMTSLRTMISNNYKFLREIERSDNSDYAKAVMTAEMLDFNMNNAEQLEVLTETLTEYVKGTEFKTSNTENIYDYIYRVSCDGSVLGGEAAMKASAYINSVNEIITASYKLMVLVLGEKIYVSDNYNSIMEAAETDADLKAALNTITSEDLAKYSVKVYRSYWAELLGNNYTKEYNTVYSLDNPDSTVSKYNRTVLDNWFTFIREVRFSDSNITVNFVRLNSALNSTTPEECGFKRTTEWVTAEKRLFTTRDNINSKISGALTREELKKFYDHIVNSDLLCTDENGNRISLYTFFSDYGFTFEKLGNDQNPVFIYSADAERYTRSSSNLSPWYQKASYTGYIGNNTSTESVTVLYFNLHYNKWTPIEDGCTDNNAIMIFEAA
ncbi:MAG: hypothetical protein KBT46_04395 [Ruminococcus sp.]|nr:hypothetical protein [Candidatus Copronaster equi]